MTELVDDGKDKVVNFREERKKRAASIKIKVPDLAFQTAEVMKNGITAWPPFRHKFHILADEHGERIILREDHGVVSRVSTQHVDAAILQYWNDVLSPILDIGSQYMRTVSEARNYWLHSAVPLSPHAIKPVAFKSEKSLTYHRIWFDPQWSEAWTFEQQCPLFAEMMSRTTNYEALIAWIGSLFDPHSTRQQYVWLVGSGGAGKSTLIRRLATLFGPSMATEYPPNSGDRFWTSGLIGKRLVIFPDMDSARFVTTGLFKALTGDDKVRIEFKGGAIINLTLPAKYLFSSNEEPGVTDNEADMRRIILCNMKPAERLQEGSYELNLQAEVERFISYCCFVYNAQGHKRAIPCDMVQVRKIARQNTAEFDTIIDTHFSLSGDDDSILTAERMEGILLHYYRHNKRERDALRKHIRAWAGIDGSERIRVKGRLTRVYPGIYLKSRDPFNQNM